MHIGNDFDSYVFELKIEVDRSIAISPNIETKEQVANANEIGLYVLDNKGEEGGNRGVVFQMDARYKSSDEWEIRSWNASGSCIIIDKIFSEHSKIIFFLLPIFLCLNKRTIRKSLNLVLSRFFLNVRNFISKELL